jgi:DNA repair photolyase
MLEARQASGIITKNALVARDLDLLEPLAKQRLAEVNLSITSLDAELQRTLEPRTSSPQAKLAAMRKLAAAGVPVRVMVAPVIPGLTDHEMPKILEAAAEAGATSAGYTLLRLPLAVRPIFLDWLGRNYATKLEKVKSLIRDTRSGALNDPNFGSRMRGDGPYAEQIRQTFKVYTKRYGLDRPLPEADETLFRPPRPASGQMSLF